MPRPRRSKKSAPVASKISCMPARSPVLLARFLLLHTTPTQHHLRTGTPPPRPDRRHRGYEGQAPCSQRETRETGLVPTCLALTLKAGCEKGYTRDCRQGTVAAGASRGCLREHPLEGALLFGRCRSRRVGGRHDVNDEAGGVISQAACAQGLLQRTRCPPSQHRTRPGHEAKQRARTGHTHTLQRHCT
jgi:hypothetical protein